MHPRSEFGLTYRKIEADSFRIDRKVQILLISQYSSLCHQQVKLKWIIARMLLDQVGLGDTLKKLL